MPKKIAPVELSSFDDIFNPTEAAANTGKGSIATIPLNELHPFENYPFRVHDDAAMTEMVESIREGTPVLPCMVRPRSLGGYEIIAGQRTVRACELAGLPTVPAIICEMDDDTATIAMVNNNLPQEQPLDSELAWALRMKLEALVHRGRKVEGIDPGTLSVDILIEQTGMSKNQIYRYVHLTELVPALLDMVDAGKIAFSVAADHLYKLTRAEQLWLLNSMEKYENTPSASQAIRLKQHSKAKTLTQEISDEIMAEIKKEPMEVTLIGSKLRQFFPDEYTPKQMEDVILTLLESWQRTRQIPA